jgi:hypothetical protein
LSEAHGLEKSHQFFRIRFKTEQYRLLDWAAIVKLSEDDDSLLISRASRQILLDVLDQQCRLMLRFGRLDDRLRALTNPLLCEEAVLDKSSTADVDWETAAISEPLQSRFPSTNQLLNKALSFIHQTSKYPTRLRWAITDKGKIEEILQKLTTLNDYLHELLNGQQLQQFSVLQTRTNYQIMQLNNKIDHLCELVEAGNLSFCNSLSLTSISLSTSFRGGLSKSSKPPSYEEPQKELANLAQVKALMSAIETGSLTDDFRHKFSLADSPAASRPIELPSSEIQFLGSPKDRSKNRTKVVYKPADGSKQNVWIEWRQPQQLDQDASQPRDSRSLKRFEALVKLLREDKYTGQFRTFRCLGYCVDPYKETGLHYGLVFDNPEWIDSEAMPVSMNDLLNTPKAPAPSLSLRLGLMKTLVECVERLHAVDWLHKGLRSQNIIFYPSCPGQVDVSQPFISGFDYSRPENADYCWRPGY